MAKQVKLTAERRSAVGRSAVRKLKARGVVPAVIYGAKDKAEPLQISRRDITALLSHASGENVLVELEVTGGGATNRLALVQEVQHAPVSGEILHVDFHSVAQDEVIHAEVSLEPTGLANGVKNEGGLLEQSVRALAVECLPRDLPDLITVDVSALNIGDAIHVRDIQLPQGVTTKLSGDLTVFSVLAPTVEEAAVAATEVAGEAAAGPEVIKEKKEEPTAAGAAAPAKEQKK